MEWYRLKLAGLKSSKIRILMEKFQNYRDIFEKIEEIRNDFNLTTDDIQLILNSKSCETYLEIMNYLDNNRVGIIGINDYRYPKNLKNIAKPPLFLFYKGNVELWSKERVIAVVGTRRATKYGELGCEHIIKDLVDGDVVVVSGLALGIDSLAHRDTLKLKGDRKSVV